MPSKKVVVLGAGVIGLQTAVTLLEAGHDVTIVAEHLPGDEAPHYTSPWAGAIWRTHASRDETEVCGWDTETYHAWREMLALEEKEGRAGESGLKFLPAIQYWDVVTPEIEHGISSVWWRTVISDFAPIPTSDLPTGVHLGVSYTTFAINVPKYLSYLQSRILSLGGHIHRLAIPRDNPGGLAAVASLAISHAFPITSSNGASELTNPTITLVNATGVGAKFLVPDDAVHVVQGQTVLVRGEAERHVCRLGKEILDVNITIPRPGAGITVVGSSRNPGTWNTEPDEETIRGLLEKGKQLAPELLDENGEFDVVGPAVGLRPYRKGGPRVEREKLPNGQTVIHAYGHAGAGYQNSIGSARKVLRLLEEA